MNELAQERTPLTVREFQEAIKEGKIEGYRCANCGHMQIDIIEFCPVCHSSELRKTVFSSTGKVVTFTIQQVAPEQFMNEVPYAWAVVQLENGPRITGWIPFVSKPSDLPIGQKVEFKKSYLPGTVFEKVK